MAGPHLKQPLASGPSWLNIFEFKKSICGPLDCHHNGYGIAVFENNATMKSYDQGTVSRPGKLKLRTHEIQIVMFHWQLC